MYEDIPENLRPISPWTYFGLSILFNVPIVGFIFLVIFSISRGNINRRNFARSYFCVFVIALFILLIVLLTGGLGSIATWLSNTLNS
ncbi:MAG: ABC transporter permease [Clostridia bacterium]|nr:ABC transporter permease [Clostridia bacterium]